MEALSAASACGSDGVLRTFSGARLSRESGISRMSGSALGAMKFMRISTDGCLRGAAGSGGRWVAAVRLDGQGVEAGCGSDDPGQLGFKAESWPSVAVRGEHRSACTTGWRWVSFNGSCQCRKEWERLGEIRKTGKCLWRLDSMLHSCA